MKYIIYVMAIGFLSCQDVQTRTLLDKERVKKEVEEMLSNYYSDIKRRGLTAEFGYLDKSEDFFWVPPGFESTLNYDSVRTLVGQNAKMFKSVDIEWETLNVFPLTNQIASFSGTLRGKMTDTTGTEAKIRLIESGTAIKRGKDWKLLNGQTALMDAEPERVEK